MAATIAFTDSQNGGGFTVAVSGTNVAATNTLYAQLAGASTWQTIDDRTGDGNITGTLAPGYYFFHLVSELAGDQSCSNVLGLCGVTRDDEAVYEAILNAVQAEIQSLTGSTLSWVASANVVRRDTHPLFDSDLFGLQMPGCVVVTDGNSEVKLPGTNVRDDILYSVPVVLLESKVDADADPARLMLGRQVVRRHFSEKRLTSIPAAVADIYRCEVQFGKVCDYLEDNLGVTGSELLINVYSREARGV